MPVMLVRYGYSICDDIQEALVVLQKDFVLTNEGVFNTFLGIHMKHHDYRTLGMTQPL